MILTASSRPPRPTSRITASSARAAKLCRIASTVNSKYVSDTGSAKARRARSTASKWGSKASSLSISPSTRARSFNDSRCGEVWQPTREPACSKMDSSKAQIEPLPLVPPTVMIGHLNASWSAFFTALQRSRPRSTGMGCAFSRCASQSGSVLKRCIMDVLSLVQKALTRLQISGARKRRQALPKAPSVGSYHQARIAHHHYAAIGFGANQAARALLERNHCLRQLIGHKGVLSLLRERVQTGGKHRVVRRRERQFIDDDQGKRFAAHIHPFPKTLTADQNGVARLLEAFQQFSTAGVALYQQRKIPVARMQSLAQLGRKPFNRA